MMRLNSHLLSTLMLLAALGAYGCQKPPIGGPDMEEIQAMQPDRSVPGHEMIPDPLDSLKLTKAQGLALADSVVAYGARVAWEAEEFEAWFIKNRSLPALDTMSDSTAAVMLERLEAADAVRDEDK